MLAAPDGFSSLPGAIARELEGAQRVVVILLDAFGWTFVQRHARHPLLARIARDGLLAPMAAQFPSTTTAHVTTMHTGLPVEAHGLYEWRVWEPSLRRVIVPLLVAAEDGFDPRSLLPDGPSFYQRLAARAGVASTVFSPARFSPSTYDAAAIRGATLVPYDDLVSGARTLAASMAATQDKAYAYLYFDGIDAAGHAHGPSSPEFDDACLRALEAVFAAFFGPQAPRLPDTLLVVTADHGQIDVSPERVDHVDLLVDDLAAALTAPPAGSARDLFLHVADEDVDATLAMLNAALGDRGHAVRSSTLFAAPGPRLRDRLAAICVLPAPGRMAWLATHADDVQLQFRGHHGGRTPQEATTFVGALRLG
ncbi:MAG TPA: alkaline phosphatase family protein [Baekduia sp.]|nr:alkaline phosphatase family protein [Baekduia sp.]